MKKERQSNFECMRIMAILMIIAWHVLVHGRLMEGIGEPYSFLSNVILSLLIVHVNSLIFLTGYFNGEKKEIRPSKAWKLLGEGWFYRVVILLVFLALGICTLTKVQMMEELFPINLFSYWFLNCYIVIYLLSPYLNRVTNRMTEKEFVKFLLILIGLVSVLPVLTNGGFMANNGYNIMNFTIMYYLGSYCKKYPIKEKALFKELSKRKWMLLLLGTYLLIAMIRVGFYYLGNTMENINSNIMAYWGNVLKCSFLSYASPFVILQSCIFCLFFESMNLKNKMINYMASTTLGIYLIHDNTIIRSWIYDFLKITRFGSSKKVFLVLVGTTIFIYISCFLIESIRKGLVKILEQMKKKQKKSSS